MSATEAVLCFVQKAGDCASAMLDNATYIKKEMPSVDFQDGLRSQVEDVCAELDAANFDILSELRDLFHVAESGKLDSAQIIADCDLILSHMADPVRNLDRVVRASHKSGTPDARNALGSMLITESATNIVNAYNAAAEAADNLKRVMREFIFYPFSRSKLERCDLGDFLSLYVPDKLPAGKRLREMMNKFVFYVQGWDGDSREIHSIPEIRRFCSAFHDRWPYWLYFCNLEAEALRMMVFCCLPTLSAVSVDGASKAFVKVDNLELLRFISGDFGAMNAMCEKAELAEREIYDRTKAVFEYFDLPFDAEPPP